MKFKSIKDRLTFWFLMVALLPLLITGVINYRQRVKAIEERSFEKLVAIRDLKIKEIDKWFNEKINDLKTMSEDPETRSIEPVFHKESYTAEDRDLLDRVREALYRYIDNYTDYHEIFIMDPQSGIIKISTTRSLEGENRTGNPYLTEPLKTRGIYVKDIFYSKHLNRVSMTFSTPVFCRAHGGEHIVAILVLRVLLEQSVYDLLHDYSGLGETGETLIVNKDLMALNSLRGSDQPPLTVKLDVQPALLASQGKTGIVEAVDYRGKKVLAAYGHVPKTGWGFVAKQDIDEIKSPIRRMLADLIGVGFLLCGVVYLVALFLSRSVARPVLEMTGISRKIQEGDMNARNTCVTADELGFLSRSFNQMADTLAYQMEIQKIGADITDLLAKASNLMEFSEKIVHKLMAVTGAELAAIYLVNPENRRFEPYFSIGAMPEALESFDGERFEGELGKVIATRSVSYIDSIPEGTVFKIKSMPGVGIPRAMLTIPVMAKNKVMAVITLAGFKPFPPHIAELLKRSWIIALHTSFSNLLANEETKILAGELSYKNQELKEQADELTAQAEKLKLQSDELQKKNEELNQKRLQVEEANRMKSQFLSNMSHELRTPLNSVMALSRVLIMQSSEKLSEEEMKYLEIIERNGRHLLELINDILDLSKIESGKMDIVVTHFSLPLVVDAIIESVLPMAASKGVDLKAEIPAAFPDLKSDKTRVHQILQNIIGNAVKFTERGSVIVSFRAEGDICYVDVRDTGIGIPEDQLHKIFEEFCQVDGTSSRKYQGTGLGLTIAKKSAELLGGDIHISSVLGQGSLFTLRLPRLFTAPGEQPRADALEAADPSVKPSEKGVILVVDDDRHQAAVIANYLKEEGYETIIAHSGKEALEIAKKTPVFAITIDIIMPEMDGLELLQALKQDPATCEIKAIIVSVSEDMETGFALGAVGYVSKPVKKSLLIQEIYNALKDEKENPSDYLIMITDDNEIDRETMERIVTSLGMTAITAENGKACIELIREVTPDLLILDLVMPEADGFQVLAYLRGRPQYENLPVIIVTAKDLDGKEWRTLKEHVCSVLDKKNLSKDNLIMSIDRCIGGSQIKLKTENEISPAQVKGADGKPPSLPLILVIEDNPDNMTTIQAVLRKDYRVIGAEDGETGLRRALAEKPDLILLDISLPGIDGVTLAKTIKTMAPIRGIPLVALTAQAMKGDREKFLNAGCDDYVSKPFDPQKLMATIGMILSGPTKREEEA